MKKKLNIIWNVISAISVLYLTSISCMYFVMFLIDGAEHTLKHTHLDEIGSFLGVIAVVVLIIHVTDKIIIEQFIRAREIIEEKADKYKKKRIKEIK